MDDKIYCIIDGEENRFMTKEEIISENLNVILAFSDWNSIWEEIVPFDIKHINEKMSTPTIYLTRKSCRIVPGKAFNT